VAGPTDLPESQGLPKNPPPAPPPKEISVAQVGAKRIMISFVEGTASLCFRHATLRAYKGGNPTIIAAEVPAEVPPNWGCADCDAEGIPQELPVKSFIDVDQEEKKESDGLTMIPLTLK